MKIIPQIMKVKRSLITEIKNLILQSREQAIRAVDNTRVLMYWNIGKCIFEEEQAGKERADYGAFLIKSLSEVLQPEFGSGFSIRQLERYRQFFRTFPIASALRTQFSWINWMKAWINIPAYFLLFTSKCCSSISRRENSISTMVLCKV